ncbi:MAG: hypothetical protein ACLFUW_09990 [Bacteroidales bacterium]
MLVSDRADIGGVRNRMNEIGICASSRHSAQKALNLICASHNILTGDDFLFGSPPEAVPADPEEFKAYKNQKEKGLTNIGSSISAYDFPLACHMAARVSRKRKFTYALVLLQQSRQLHYNHPMEFEPKHFPYEHRSPDPTDHVRFAYAIVMSYAVLEQLGLALHEKAFHNKQWIPEKRAELENRLKNSGVDYSHPVLWLRRGGKAKLEALRSTLTGIKTNWASGKVRDNEILIVDAIAEIRWHRSKVSAHKMDELVGTLSVHDVFNSQSLASRLFLEVMGYLGELPEKIRQNPLK